MRVTADELRKLLIYVPATGQFFWRQRRSGVPDTSKPAGQVKRTGYRDIGVRRGHYPAHVLAWLYVKGEWPAGPLDHKNLIKDDNRINNLRLASGTENNANQPISSRNTSGFKGVTWNRRCGKWQAAIKVKGKNHHLGLFSDPESAHRAYMAAAQEKFGEFARAS